MLLRGLMLWGSQPTSRSDWIQYQLDDAILRHDVVSARSAIRSGADVNHTHLPIHAPNRIFCILGVSRDEEDPYYYVLWPDRNEGNPLDAPSEEGAPMLKLLLASGANPNAHYGGGWSALVKAEERGGVASMELLIESGAAVNCNDERYFAPLIAAARTNIADEVTLLVKHGADINAREPIGGNTPLMIACYYDCPNTVRALLRLGASKTIKSYSGNTAFSMAKSNPRILKLLNGEGDGAVRPMRRASASGYSKTKIQFRRID